VDNHRNHLPYSPAPNVNASPQKATEDRLPLPDPDTTTRLHNQSIDQTNSPNRHHPASTSRPQMFG
jgi:hypothetical protein